MGEFVLSNARIVMADRVAEGWLAVANGSIAEYGEGRYAGVSSDVEGDFLLPGLVELHTDHLEAHAMPRPKVTWDPRAAVLAYDAQIVGIRHNHRV